MRSCILPVHPPSGRRSTIRLGTSMRTPAERPPCSKRAAAWVSVNSSMFHRRRCTAGRARIPSRSRIRSTHDRHMRRQKSAPSSWFAPWITPYGTCSAIVRPFSVYGPRMGAHALLPAILRQLGSSGPLRLADLRPERDYCHVDDVARAIVGAARTPHRGTVALNAGSGIGTSVRELAETALRLAGLERSLEEDVAGRRPGQSDILRLVADRRLASQMLGWEPQISLETGVREMLSAYTSPA